VACDTPDKAQTPTVHGLDELLRRPIVAEGMPRRFDPAGDGRVRDHAPGPDRFHDLVFGYQAIGVFDEQKQQLEYLRLDGQGNTALAQLDLAGVQLEFVERIDHRKPTVKSP